MSQDTSTPRSARDHARSLAGSLDAAATRARPTVPVLEAADLPPGIDAHDLVWDETLAAGGYSARILERGTRLRIENVEGDACVALLAYNADQPAERLNVADTVKVQWQAYPGAQSLLLSDMGRVLLSFVEDTSGRHDALCGASNARSNAEKYGDGSVFGPCPSVRDRFAQALGKQGLGRRDICPNINLFKRVRVAPDGSLEFDASPGLAGEHVELRAEMRVLVVLVNAPHVLDPRCTYLSGMIRLLARRGRATPEPDAIRNSSPERLRAFQNVEDYYNA